MMQSLAFKLTTGQHSCLDVEQDHSYNNEQSGAALVYTN